MKTIWLMAIAIIGAHGEGEDTSWFNCIPGIVGSIGVTTPRGDVNLLHNSEPVELFCHMSPYHQYFKKGYTSADLAFIINGQDKDRKIIRMQVVSEIVNKTTIKTKFDPLQVGHFNVRCQLTIKKTDAIENKYENEINDLNIEEKDALTEIGVCPQRVHVGYPPLDVENFSCISDNWENLNCTWDEPYNPIRTTYRLDFKEPGRRSPYRQCPNRTDLQKTLMRKIPLGLKTCYVDETTHPPYRKPMKKLLYLFNATNALEPTGSIMTTQIDHYAVVKPGPAQSLQTEGLPNNGLKFSYEIPRQMRHFPSGLIQDIQFRNQWSDEWTIVDTTAWNLENNSFSHELEELDHAWTNYTIQVKMLSGKGNISDPKYWSKVSEITGSTLATRPQFAPRTHPGSFEVITGQKERTVIMYWEKLQEKDYNGPNFEYVITDVLEGEKSFPIQPSNQMSAYAEFKRLKLDNYTFFVTSKNEIGPAPNVSKIFVAQKDKLTSIQPISITKTYLEEKNTVEVAWFPPKDKSMIQSYTIFWCKFPKERPYQCDGKLDWVDVEPYPKNQTMIHKIPLPDSEIYQLAVAANTEHYSSGMVWSTCSIIKNKVLSKVKDVTVDNTGEDFALVRWRLDCSDRGRVVVGYQIEYCPLKTESDTTTWDEAVCKTKNVTAADGEQTKILNLSPWTPYKIGVRVLTRGEPGERSDPVIERTNPALPGSEPLNMKISPTNETATIHWTPPAIPNGRIDFYKYKYWTGNKKSGVVTFSNVTNETMVELPNLLAFTEYTFEIRACNVLDSKVHGCSEFDSKATFMTKRGKPGQPNEPKVIFTNATNVEINWDTNFQLGAPEALYWDIKVSRAGEIWEQRADHDAGDILVNGTMQNHTLDLSTLGSKKDWSPNCENSTNTNLFNFTIRAIVLVDGNNITGLWSEPITVPAYCRVPLPWLTLILVSIIATSVAIVAVIGLCRAWTWFHKKKEFFDKLGRELDDKFINASVDEVGNDKSKEYGMTNFGDKNGRKPSYSRADSKDSMETLLNNEKNHQESGRSDTTSGCESGQSSELGDDGINRGRNDSSASEESPEGNKRHMDDENKDNTNEVMDGSMSEEFFPSDESTPTHTKPNFGYVPTKNGLLDSTWPARAKEAEHYTKFMPTLPTANYVGYSKVGTPPGPVVTRVDHPSLDSCPGYVNNVNQTNNVNSNAQPTPGYVTFSSVKLGEPENKPTPGYITVDQVNKQSLADSKNPALLACDTTSPTKDQHFSTIISPGYSRVGISPSSLGYVPNIPNKTEAVTNEFLKTSPYLDNSWASDETSKFPFKPSLGYVQAPLHARVSVEQKKDEFAEPLLITPRNLSVNSPSPYNEVITRFSEGPAASMV
eukprot:TRINITY_DN14855_c0_g1_i1.p1 TRINITY_DN14855_c0_g1~~TRINITY_DN14855_c0_g1_i1.p1  ORF type:complete len:1361 (-),score=228.52 TRINITY_DN14855_c0_g1_i1:1042-5124(-)